MADRAYLVPMEIDESIPARPRRRPKYFADGTFEGIGWSANDYGFEPWVLVLADLTDKQIAILIVNTDVYAFPESLDDKLQEKDLATLQGFLENAKIPAEWIATSHSWREILRSILQIFSVGSRFTFLLGEAAFTKGITLDSKVEDLPALDQAKLDQTAKDQGLTKDPIAPTDTLRTILKELADQKTGPQYLGSLNV